MTGFMENPIVLTDAERVELNQRAAVGVPMISKAFAPGSILARDRVRPLSNHRKGNTALQV
jgi:hypothetical protein